MIAPTSRGYHAVYHEHETNHCPGCGRMQWLIGRLTAECAFCSTSLPLNSTLTSEARKRPELWTRGNGGGRVR